MTIAEIMKRDRCSYLTAKAKLEGEASSSSAAQCSTAREPEMMWVCGTWGVGVDFLTHSTEIAMAWKNENEWHSAHQKPVRSNT